MVILILLPPVYLYQPWMTRKTTVHIPLTILLLLSVTSCDQTEVKSPSLAGEVSQQDIFFERIKLLCGKAYSGQLTSDQPADADFVGKPMIMHVAKCELNEIQIPFQVAESENVWNRSRTWIISRTEGGLRLKHRHRHEDGSLDAVTNYGGDTEDDGTAEQQNFPIDAESIASFKANGLDKSLTNIWSIELTPPGENNAQFVYQLSRPASADSRLFRVEFDLSRPVALPPPAWGD